MKQSFSQDSNHLIAVVVEQAATTTTTTMKWRKQKSSYATKRKKRKSTTTTTTASAGMAQPPEPESSTPTTIKMSHKARRRTGAAAPTNCSSFLLVLLFSPLIIQLQLNCDTTTTTTTTTSMGMIGGVSASSTSSSSGASQEDLVQQQQQRFLSEPSDTVAHLGQAQVQLTCLIANKRGHVFWMKNMMWLSDEDKIYTHSRYSMLISSSSTPVNETSSSIQPQVSDQLLAAGSGVSNYTLNIVNVSLLDDGHYVCAVNEPDEGANAAAAGDSDAAKAENQQQQPKQLLSRRARLEVVQAPSRLEISSSKVESSLVDNQSLVDNNSAREESETTSTRATPNGADNLHQWGLHEVDMADQQPQRPITRIVVKENDLLKLECKANQAKPRAELVWLDSNGRKVPRLPPPSGSGGVGGSGSGNGSSHGGLDFAEELVSIDPDAPRLELASLIWPFRVQRHHHNQILTCRAHHKAFELPLDQQGQSRRDRPAYLEDKIQLDVQYEPVIEGLVKNESREGQPVKFSCSAHGRPTQLAYSWTIDEQLVENANRSELRLAQLTRQLHMRDVRCHVSNAVGNSTAVQRPAVKYSPAYVTHLLPSSLQPDLHQASYAQHKAYHHHHQPDINMGGGGGASPTAGTPTVSVQQTALAQQLALGFREGAQVTLRCDFDANPRPESIEWFKINTDYDSMTDVTPQEADELMEFGAGHASFVHVSQPAADPQVVSIIRSNQQQTVHQKRHIDWDHNNSDKRHQQQEVWFNQNQLDYEQMSAELLTELSLYEHQQQQQQLGARGTAPSATDHSSAPLFTPIGNTTDLHTTQTVAKISEPLGWLFMSPTSSAASRSGNYSAAAAGPDDDLLTLMSAQQQQPQASKLNYRQAQLTSSQLSLRHFNADQTGRYVCRANGERPGFRSAARAIFLVLRQRPRIISVGQQWAPIGAPLVQVECLAQINTVHDNQTAIVWLRDGKVIKASKSCDRQPYDRSAAGHQQQQQHQEKCIDVQVKFSPDLLFMRSILRIHNPNYQDFGLYNCTITNSIRADHHTINLQPSEQPGLTFRLLAALTVASVFLFVLIISSILAFAPCKRLDAMASKSAAIISCSASSASSGSSRTSSSSPDRKTDDTDHHSDPHTTTKGQEANQDNPTGDEATDKEALKSSMLLSNQQTAAMMMMMPHQQPQSSPPPPQLPPGRPGSAFGPLSAASGGHLLGRSQSQLRSSLRYQSQPGNAPTGANKFAAIHESLENTLRFGQQHQHDYVHPHLQQQQQQQLQLQQQQQQLQQRPFSGSTGGSDTTTTDVSETSASIINDHHNNHHSAAKPAHSNELAGGLMERIWFRLHQNKQQQRRTRAAKSRPTISMPVQQQQQRKGCLSTGSQSSSVSLRRSSLSDSLTVVNGQQQQQQVAITNGVHHHNSSRSNLIHDSRTASSDGLATTSCSSSSGRSSSTSNQPMHHQVAQQQQQQQQQHQPPPLPPTLSGQQQHYLAAAESGMWPTPAALAAAAHGIYANGVMNINNSPVYTNEDVSPSVSYLADQQQQQQLAWAYPQPKQQQEAVHFDQHQVAEMNSSNNINGHYQLPLQVMMMTAASNEPYQVAIRPTATTATTTTTTTSTDGSGRPCYATICNKQQVSMSGAINNNNNFQLPTNDGYDAFYESNYGTLISKSSAYKTLGYTAANSNSSNANSSHSPSSTSGQPLAINSIITSTASASSSSSSSSMSPPPQPMLPVHITNLNPTDRSSLASSAGSPNSLTTHANNTSHTNSSSQQQHHHHHHHLYNQLQQQQQQPQANIISTPQLPTLYHPNELSVLTSAVKGASNHNQQHYATTATIQADGTTTLTTTGKINRASPAILANNNNNNNNSSIQEGLATHV